MFVAPFPSATNPKIITRSNLLRTGTTIAVILGAASLHGALIYNNFPDLTIGPQGSGGNPDGGDYGSVKFDPIALTTIYRQDWLFGRPPALDLCVVFYERLVDDAPGELGRIAGYLGLHAPPETLRVVAREHALKEMKTRQPHHVFRGGWGGWLEHLDDRQIHTAQRIAGRLTKTLGYPLNRAEAAGWTSDRSG